jgi:chemotaxis family two-component system sensor histidine kinase/response regulator PixL
MQSKFSWQSPQSNHSPTTAGLTVRVDADRLERMNNLVGELSINRSSLSLQNDQLQRVLRELRQRFARFQSLVTKLQTLPEQMVTPEREWAMTTHRLHSNGASNRLPFDRATYPSAIEFDALEMDHYGAAYSNLQEILEDLVQLEESVDDIALFTRQSNQALEQQQHKLTQLRDELVWARMLPLSEVLNRFPRILRDLSVTYQKPVNLKITGAELLIDRAILEKLYDPLLHLLRNAFDHGIESPHLRQQQAKPAQGQIEIRALHQGNQTVIELRDDGQGIDLDRIRTRACELGWFSAEQVASLSTSQLIELIFEPSFSTATQVSELSGRGFGLDVVRSDLKAIRGKVSVVSVPGEGTTFTLALPLTLTITQLIICLVGPLPIALPADSIADILTPDQSSIERQTDQLQWRDQMIPVYSFADLLNYACPTPKTVANQILAAFPAPKDWAAPIVVIQHEQQFFGLAVERIITEQELVIKPFGAALASPNYLYGCTILGDGSAVPVVDAVALLAISQQPANTISGSDTSSSTRSEAAVPPGVPTAIQMAQAPTILVVDDAITLRRTLALFLEREGFRVLQAQDGQEAMDQLQQAAVQLIVCDIEMPNMNGFEFLNARRQDSQLVQIPVVMLTSRSNEKHRWLALKLGANAYFTKPYLEQEFLSALKTLVTPVVV